RRAACGACWRRGLRGPRGDRGPSTGAGVREMARHVERPLVFPMSNPTSKTEAKPADILAWTEGRALVATGSPFEAVSFGRRTVTIGQGNNAFVFPGVGLGALVAEAGIVTDALFAAAADALAAEVHTDDLAAGSLFPPVRDIRRVTARVAEAVVKEARDSGVGRQLADADIPEAVTGAMWNPVY